MTVEELYNKLKQVIQSGDVDADVMVRDLSVSEEAMEAGSSGYKELEEVLIVHGVPHLLITEDY